MSKERDDYEPMLPDIKLSREVADLRDIMSVRHEALLDGVRSMKPGNPGDWEMLDARFRRIQKILDENDFGHDDRDPFERNFVMAIDITDGRKTQTLTLDMRQGPTDVEVAVEHTCKLFAEEQAKRLAAAVNSIKGEGTASLSGMTASVRAMTLKEVFGEIFTRPEFRENGIDQVLPEIFNFLNTEPYARRRSELRECILDAFPEWTVEAAIFGTLDKFRVVRIEIEPDGKDPVTAWFDPNGDPFLEIGEYIGEVLGHDPKEILAESGISSIRGAMGKMTLLGDELKSGFGIVRAKEMSVTEALAETLGAETHSNFLQMSDDDEAPAPKA